MREWVVVYISRYYPIASEGEVEEEWILVSWGVDGGGVNGGRG